MRIAIVCSSSTHPVFRHLELWTRKRSAEHEVQLVNRAEDARGGDILFLISCHEIVSASVREAFRHSLVVHASELPKGRGWSPHVWQILEGSNTIPVTLLEAEDKLDSGAIWTQVHIQLEGHELYGEVNERLSTATLQLMDFAVENHATVSPRQQDCLQATYYRRRTPDDSFLDPHKTIAEQFDLLRIADADRFPCFFDYRGKRYIISLRKESGS